MKIRIYMPLFGLTKDILFPFPSLAEADGLLAVGGDLSVERLLEAYRQGIFPWYGEGSPILWWFIHPRCVLKPDRLHVPRSLKRTLRSSPFTFTVNKIFEQVIAHCAQRRRPGQESTWIVPEMLAAYTRLHQAGWAHSIEAWQRGKLAGGLYGLVLGRVFFGESMFYLKPDASKAAFVWLVRHLRLLGFTLVDCQQKTEHMARLGAEMLSGEEFSSLLKEEFAVSLEPAPEVRRFFLSGSIQDGL